MQRKGGPRCSALHFSDDEKHDFNEPDWLSLLLAQRSRLPSLLLILLAAVSAVATGWVVLLGGFATVTEFVVDSVDYLLRVPQHQSVQTTWLLGFAALSLSLQLLIVPSGSLLLVGAGFVFGVFPSVVIYTLMQCIAIWPIYWLCRFCLERNRWGLQDKVNLLLEKSGVCRVTRSEPLISGMVLRLTPVLPSAAASSIASVAGIQMSVFFLATVLAGWVRPLFFASIGGAVKEFSGFASTLSGEFRVAPLLLVFFSVLLLLVVKLWLRRRG